LVNAILKGETDVVASLSDKLKTLPDASGVYIMYDADKAIIYVGKT